MDIIRAISILAVVLIHVSALIIYRSGFDSNMCKLSIIINQISRFSVPAFILISGIGLTLSFKEDEGYFKFIKHRFNKIIPSYILWCVIYTYYTTRSFEINNLINSIIHGSAFYHLYYIPLIIEFYLVYPFIHRVIGTKWGLLISFLLTFGIIVFTRYYTMSNEIKWFLDKKNLLDWIFYFSFGAFIAKNMERCLILTKKYRNLIVILFLISTYIVVNDCMSSLKLGKDIEYAVNFMRPSVFIYSVFMILFIFSIQWEKNIFLNIINYISKSSYSIYLSHAIILDYLVIYYSKNSLSLVSAAFVIKAFFAAVIGSMLINEGKKYL
ncbi:acyltransferase [Clostridium drakei]|nr:acyltransferase [Clostridium drakei]